MLDEEMFRLAKLEEKHQRDLLARKGYITEEADWGNDYYKHTDYFLHYKGQVFRTDCKMRSPEHNNFLINYDPNFHGRGPLWCEFCHFVSFTVGDYIWFVPRKKLLAIVLKEFQAGPVWVSPAKTMYRYPTFKYFPYGKYGPFITLEEGTIIRLGRKL